jgi:MFS family permease
MVLSNAMIISTNAFALFQCFPYAGYMVVWLGKAKTKDEAGYYAGYLGAGFMIGRASTSLLWGIIADIKGRKLVMMIGCFAMIVFQIMFGLAQTFEVALASRILLGIFNGLVGTSKTVASEIVNRDRRDHQALSMSILSAGVSVASLLGPAIGGWLSDPANQYPGSMFDVEFFQQYPYFLPNLAGAFLAFVSMVLCFFCLEETLVKKQAPLQRPLDGTDQSVFAKEKEVPLFRQMLPLLRESLALIQQPAVRVAVLWYSIHSMFSIYVYEIFPLWLLATKESGGMEFGLAAIGSIQSITGLVLLLYQSFLFPKIAKKVLPVQLWSRSGILLFPLIVAMPFLALLSHHTEISFVLSAVLRSVQIVLDMTMFTCSFLLINNSCDGDKRGAANGLAMSVASVFKSVGPIVGGVIFAWSATNGLAFPLDHHFSFFLVAVLTLMESYFISKMPKHLNRMKGLGIPTKTGHALLGAAEDKTVAVEMVSIEKKEQRDCSGKKEMI